MKVCEGSVTEARYSKDSRNNTDEQQLVCTQDATFYEGAIAYIADWLGYHKIGNPSKSQPAVTLHLYSPPLPFDSCKIWLDPSKATRPNQVLPRFVIIVFMVPPLDTIGAFRIQ